MLSLTIIQKISIWLIPVLLAITLHEAAHAWAAYRCGDTTAKMFGRLSINPIRHIDLVGTIIVPIVIGVLTNFQFIFGWAKPVPINWTRLHHPKRDMALVSLAGPLANIIMALCWGACLKLSTMNQLAPNSAALFLSLSAQAGIIINLILAILNLLPIPPLDGSKVIASLLPIQYADYYLQLERYGFLVLLLLLFTGLLNLVFDPILSWALQSFRWLFQL